MIEIKDNKYKKAIEAILRQFSLDDCQSVEEVFSQVLKNWGYYKEHKKDLLEVTLSMILDGESICKIMDDWSERNYQIAEMLGYGDAEYLDDEKDSDFEDDPYYEKDEEDLDYEDDGVCDCDCEHCVRGCICE